MAALRHLEQLRLVSIRQGSGVKVRDVLADAGFSKTEVYWEGTDRKTGEGNDIFKRRESGEDDPAWICYVAGIR